MGDRQQHGAAIRSMFLFNADDAFGPTQHNVRIAGLQFRWLGCASAKSKELSEIRQTIYSSLDTVRYDLRVLQYRSFNYKTRTYKYLYCVTCSTRLFSAGKR